jgi:protein TonB
MERKLFADLVESDTKGHRPKRSLAFSISVALHAIGLLAVVIVPLLQAQELPEPAAAVKAFFVEPAAAPPPPPPPPPPAPKVVQQKAPPPVQETKFVAPVEVPQEIKPSAGIDLGSLGGAAGGVEGGVAGGVAGGIVGGLPSEPPPAVQAVRVGGNIKEPTKTKNVAPVYPDIAKQARVQGIVILECTISPQGKVTDVKVLRGIPLLDQAGIDAVKQWQYTPTLLNGVPVPVIMTVTVNFRLN